MSLRSENRCRHKPRTYRSVMTTENRLSQAHRAWFSLRWVMRCHRPWRVFAPDEQEKQLRHPPDRCRQEWQENVYMLSRTTFTRKTSDPMPTPKRPPKSNARNVSHHRISTTMTAK